MRVTMIVLMCIGILCPLAALMPDSRPDQQATGDPQASSNNQAPQTAQDRFAAAVIGIVLFIIGAAGFGIIVYNQLVPAKVLCQNAWANVDVFLKRRYDLIDNLTTLVKRYAEHEKTVFTEVASIRARAGSVQSVAEKSKVEAVLQGAVGRLLVVAESYPALLATENYQQLSAQLAETENGIAEVRTQYNAAVAALNILVKRFPEVLVARRLGFQEAAFFQAEQASREKVVV